MDPVVAPEPPPEAPAPGSEGFFVRSLPVTAQVPVLRCVGSYLCYVQQEYRHYYTDLRMSFDDYKAKFSAKTRSTIARKVKKFAAHCGGTIVWRAYSRGAEMQEFFHLARQVSSKSYQERLLGAGLPTSDAFVVKMQSMAERNLVRAYVLFDGERPVSYLYCPVSDNVVIYAYLGYDPEYLKSSVGTVLQWLAIEQLFNERRFLYFDFTEGESDHKRLFATNAMREVNIMFLRRNLKNWLLVQTHRAFDRCVASIALWLDERNLKPRVKRLIRFGMKGGAVS